ncbi:MULTISPECIES: hypothetical protein [Streptomyces]|uniref:hypothetical protein n=1 Tax=Streptomyces TaxID=1883 RepID=UPI00081B7C02|nr:MULTISPECIES: hypothetical protein [unclassified Streptomyces]RST18216.1 hypothetical protein EF908_33355 [Streptomyces sp. WAC04770]SCE41492.1 hypothetical protein GA0115244_125837 [Streptomyces sp. DvalAA-19]
MSDDVETTSAAPEASTTPEAPAAPEAAAGKGRRVALTALPFVLVLAAVGGAAAYTVQAVNGADRTVETAVWDDSAPEPGPDPAVNAARGRTDTELSRLLMPVPKGYRLGPDVGELGNDDETSGEKATAAVKETGRGLAGKQRRQLDEYFDKLRIQGVAHRSYTGESDDLLLTVQVAKMGNEGAVRRLHGRRIELLGSLGVLRKGPKIEGHKNVTCYRLPDDREDPVDGIACYAYEGGLSVIMEAEGPKPFKASTVADLVQEQLDHIKSPGMSI